MSAEATNASDLPGKLPAGPAAPNLAERTEQIAAAIEHGVVEVWNFLRFGVFVIYLLIAILSFWLWAITAAIGVVRLFLKGLMAVLLWLSGGRAPRPGPPAAGMADALRLELQHLWGQRLVVYEEFARPLARHLVGAQRATRTFWHLRPFRKAVTLAAIFWLVYVPAMYVIPRPHDVQITDDNAVAYRQGHQQDDLPGACARHARREQDAGVHQRSAWYLGKINSQGLKSQLQIGRTYRLWVVGVRWSCSAHPLPQHHLGHGDRRAGERRQASETAGRAIAAGGRDQELGVRRTGWKAGSGARPRGTASSLRVAPAPRQRRPRCSRGPAP